MITLKRPIDSDVHTIADFCELLCLISIDRTCSRESLKDYIRDSDDGGIPSDNELSDCFDQLYWRQSAFGDNYPFQIDEHRRSITAQEELPAIANGYAILLICANLPFIQRVHYHTITETFEKLSLIALKNSWPTPEDSRAFGKNQTEYSGPKWQRVNRLAEDIGGRGACTDSSFRPRDNADGGIDLVAWHALDAYERRNIPSILAQCACSRSDWTSKQSEISEDRLGNLINATHRWMQLLFIPQSYRNNHGRWAFDEVGKIILFDRLRIIKKLQDIDWSTFPIPNIFSRILAHRAEPW